LLALVFKEISEYNDKDIEEIIFLSVLICVVVTVNAFFVYIRNVLPHKFIVNKVLERKKILVKNILNSDIDKVQNWEVSDILVRVNEDMGVVEKFIGETSVECIALIASSLVAQVILLYMFLPVTVIAFITTPIFLLVISKISDKVGQNAKDIKENTVILNNQLLKSIDGNLEIQVFSKENEFINKFDKTLKEIKSENIKLKKNRLNMLSIGKFGNIIPIIVIVFLGFYFVKQGIYTLGAWLAMFYLMEFSNSIFTVIPELLSEYKEAAISVTRLKELESYFSKQKLDVMSNHKYEENRLTVKNLSFAYLEDKSVLQNIDVDIKQGEKIVIVGKSGCGKSTLIDLICGFLPYQTGEIRMWNHEKLMDFIAYADQEAVLFPATVEENIVLEYALKEDIKKRFQQVMKLVRLDEWLENTDEKENYFIGKRSNALSGGQRQKIGLARALLKTNYTDRAVLVLDEATSFIDIETEKKVIRDIFAINDLTCIFIAHRIASYEEADRILYMENGSIMESGTHFELMEKKGRYYSLLQYSM